MGVNVTNEPAIERAIARVDLMLDAARNANQDGENAICAAAEGVNLLAALKAALPRLAHKYACHSVRPASEWAEHGSASFENCSCEIRIVEAAIARAEGRS
jgi:hypothetical protein